MNPEAQLPIVYQTAANLYQTELFSLQIQGAKVTHTHTHIVTLLFSYFKLQYNVVQLWLLVVTP